MKKFLDEIDQRLLRLVQADASLSIDSLADQVNLSRNACWRRMKRMEADGIILRRVTLVNPEVIGLDLLALVFVRTNRHDPEWLTQFRNAVAQIPQITGVYRMSGDLDYVLRLRVPDVKAYDRIYQKLIAKVPLYDVSVSFVIEEIHDTTQLPLETI